MTAPCVPLSVLIETEQDFLSVANVFRGWAEKSRIAATRHRNHGMADMAEDAAKRVRELIDRHAPKKPLLRIVRESADV